ncbi:hypothetical protein BpHYR1_018133 [Brachionus plicatilis]|uniref:Uncharacterized protein n=1 Tax=Brachionus plicatilis TaxID=10195 RepID=A0A3M7RKG9_BRAPC|nr:hypothetical protein BpHYR1_018133 [Brachionus plicatilis]
MKDNYFVPLVARLMLGYRLVIGQIMSSHRLYFCLSSCRSKIHVAAINTAWNGKNSISCERAVTENCNINFYLNLLDKVKGNRYKNHNFRTRDLIISIFVNYERKIFEIKNQNLVLNERDILIADGLKYIFVTNLDRLTDIENKSYNKNLNNI